MKTPVCLKRTGASSHTHPTTLFLGQTCRKKRPYSKKSKKVRFRGFFPPSPRSVVLAHLPKRGFRVLSLRRVRRSVAEKRLVAPEEQHLLDLLPGRGLRARARSLRQPRNGSDRHPPQMPQVVFFSVFLLFFRGGGGGRRSGVGFFLFFFFGGGVGNIIMVSH